VRRPSVQDQTHDVPARTYPTVFDETPLLEGRDEPHEAVAGRVRIDRIGLDDAGSSGARRLHRRPEQAFHQAGTPEVAQDEEAGDGPDVVVPPRPAQLEVGRPGSDGAPRDRFLIEVPENSHGNAAVDEPEKRALARWCRRLRAIAVQRPPRHAPTPLRSASALEELDQIGARRATHLAKCDSSGDLGVGTRRRHGR